MLTTRPQSVEATSPGWVPLLDEADSRLAQAALREIADVLVSCDTAPDASLAGGQAGIALFFAYLSGLDQEARYAEVAAGHLERAFELVSAAEFTLSLYNGVTGVAWVCEHVAPFLYDADSDDPLQDADVAVLTSLTRDASPDEPYDLTDGWVGSGVYALERLPRSAAIEILERILCLCEQTAERYVGHATWCHPPKWLNPEQRRLFPRGRYNVGVAHGVSGVIALLARMLMAGIQSDRVHQLLNDAVAWMLSRRLDGTSGADFPSMCDRDGSAIPSRNVWCYGDPGVASALFLASVASGNGAWQELAVDIMRAVIRRPLTLQQHVDAPLCHGSAGLAHILNRFWQATGDAELAAAARGWFRRVLSEHRVPGQGVGGYLSYRPVSGARTPWQADPGVVTGSAGIGLALIAAITATEPNWDRLLCTCLPTRRGPLI